MKYKMFGIPNCDTVKKARSVLEKNQIEYEFIDFKKVDPTTDDIKRWEKYFGELPANKKGPTFRKIKEEFEKATPSQKVSLLIKNSSAIKRPIVESQGTVICIGFDEHVLKTLKS